MSSVQAPIDAAPRAQPSVPRPIVTRRRGLDRFDVAILLAFAAVSMWVLGLDLWQVVAHGRVWTGTDGSYITDQMQYVAWIWDAAHHFLASNLFVLRPTPADYFQPVITISGGITALGVAPWLSFLLWKPVAVGAAFCATRAYVRRSVTGLAARRAALALGLFFGAFSFVYGSFGVVGDLYPGFLSWGYPFGLIALAAMLGAVLSYERARSEAGWHRVVPGLLGAIASSLHPWQGETLILIVIGAELLMWRSERHLPPRVGLPAVTVILTTLPLAYYGVLGRTDLSWRLARQGSHHSFSLATILLGLVPLLLFAAFAYRDKPRGFLPIATRMWLPAAFVIYILSSTALSATPLHAFDGITVPLAVLAVEGARRAGWHRIHRHRLIGALAVAAVTIPGTVYELDSTRPLVAPAAGNGNFITRDENRALHYLARNHDPGGVLTRFYLGTIVPAKTGRRTFVGHCLWSRPDCSRRAKTVQKLFQGSLTAQAARSFVIATGAHFVLGDCASVDLARSLAPITQSVERFGCAGVYVLDPRAVGPPVT